MIDYENATMKEAALDYAGRGLRVFPVKLDKTPMIDAWTTNASSDPEQVNEWWDKWPNANIATVTGEGLDVIDADAGEGEFGPEQIEGWQNNNGSFGETWRAITGGGGLHIFIKTNVELHNVQQDQPEHLRDIDFRGYHGYVVLPPSSHKSGRRYRWDDEHSPNDLEPAQDDELLKKFHEELTPKKHKTQTTQETQSTLIAHRDPLENTLENLDVIEEGKRNGTLFSEACALVNRGWNYDAVFGAVSDLNASMCRPPLDDAEIKKIVDSATEYEPGVIRKTDSAPPSFEPIEVADYLGETFGTDIDYFKNYSGRKTWFIDIDEHLTLYPGLAGLGGGASIGKTTFANNLADNLIRYGGETVLYILLEQSPLELVTKSLARRLNEAEIDCQLETHLTNTKIKNGETCDLLEQVKRDYATDVAGKFYIMRGNFHTTAATIRAWVEQFIAEHGVKPIVFIDYLQLISPPDGFRGDTRAATDLAIKTFKDMQTKNELLVILISNFNRSGYDVPVTFESFKETGMIEYTCDYVWGLQLEILSHREFYLTPGARGDRLTTAQEKDAMIMDAINEYPKRVQFVSLKSRNGRQRYKADLHYFMPYDYFQGRKPKPPEE